MPDPTHVARLTRLDDMITLAKTLPSWPDMAADIAHLAQTIIALTTRIEALEQECATLRHAAFLRVWESEE